MRSRVLLAAVAVAALAVPPSARAQAAPTDQPQGQFTGSVEVVEVLLDALVTDKDGNTILGLGPEDFEVTENGQALSVAGVSFYSNRRLAQAAPAALAGQLSPPAATDSRYFILFLEDQKRKDGDSPAALTRQQLQALQRAEDWVKTELLPNDWVAVTSWDTRLRVQHDFTRDRESLVAAIRAAAKGEEGKGVWPSRATETKTGDEPSLVAALPSGKALSKATARLEQALTVLAKAAGTVRGRKNLILFSTGFGEINNLADLYTPDKRYYPPMMQALNTANVAVYGLDLTPSGVRNPFQDSMNLLANETGGRFYFNFVNFATPLRQIVEENNGYYLLSYTSRKPIGEAGFQKVTVRLKNPGFQVRTREGYAFGPAKG
jgi:VWFA-related protein